MNDEDFEEVLSYVKTRILAEIDPVGALFKIDAQTLPANIRAIVGKMQENILHMCILIRQEQNLTRRIQELEEELARKCVLLEETRNEKLIVRNTMKHIEEELRRESNAF